MRMLVLYVGYYGLAVLLGFLLRFRFDAWMYAKPHMQRRLVVYSSDLLDAVKAGAEAVPLPPLTVDTDAVSPLLEGTALSRFVRPTEADQRLADAADDASRGRRSRSTGSRVFICSRSGSRGRGAQRDAARAFPPYQPG